MPVGIVARGIKKVRRLLREQPGAGNFSERDLAQIRGQLKDCAEGLGSEVSARHRAARLADTYLGLDDSGRTAFLRVIATEFGPDPKAVAKAHMRYQEAIGTDALWAAESELRVAMRSARLRILTQFNSLPHGAHFVLHMRAD